uniref:uncharacterized protein LOC124006792 n=1 Tax=Oncorhynchus gorbuscha TaxID=8017 RepID=UPI001EAF29CE|nr:uncharacterized protein LOC124006792 [Oncorhynchus gorbuscha]
MKINTGETHIDLGIVIILDCDVLRKSLVIPDRQIHANVFASVLLGTDWTGAVFMVAVCWGQTGLELCSWWQSAGDKLDWSCVHGGSRAGDKLDWSCVHGGSLLGTKTGLELCSWWQSAGDKNWTGAVFMVAVCWGQKLDWSCVHGGSLLGTKTGLELCSWWQSAGDKLDWSCVHGGSLLGTNWTGAVFMVAVCWGQTGLELCSWWP